MTDRPEPSPAPRKGSIVDLLRPYWPWIVGLVVLTIGANSLNLVGPRIIAAAIDAIFSRVGRITPSTSSRRAGSFFMVSADS